MTDSYLTFVNESLLPFLAPVARPWLATALQVAAADLPPIPFGFSAYTVVAVLFAKAYTQVPWFLPLRYWALARVETVLTWHANEFWPPLTPPPLTDEEIAYLSLLA